MKGKYIGDIKPKSGDKIYCKHSQELLTIDEDNNPQVGYTFKERYNIQGEFMIPCWVKVKGVKDD